eukprot:SAG22_NODE_1659_length_3873_cov_11.321940_4_plen_20_part_01
MPTGKDTTLEFKNTQNQFKA